MTGVIATSTPCSWSPRRPPTKETAMVYSLYRRANIGKKSTRYERDKKEKEISRFGRNNGVIPLVVEFQSPPPTKMSRTAGTLTFFPNSMRNQITAVAP